MEELSLDIKTDEDGKYPVLTGAVHVDLRGLGDVFSDLFYIDALGMQVNDERPRRRRQRIAEILGAQWKTIEEALGRKGLTCINLYFDLPERAALSNGLSWSDTFHLVNYSLQMKSSTPGLGFHGGTFKHRHAEVAQGNGATVIQFGWAAEAAQSKWNRMKEKALEHNGD